MDTDRGRDRESGRRSANQTQAAGGTHEHAQLVAGTESHAVSEAGSHAQAQGAESNRDQTSGELSDDHIRGEIEFRLSDDDEIDAPEVAVIVEDGVVTLVGSIAGDDQNRKVARIAESVSGVTQVVNSLTVSP
ncbi:MAG: BON domain-containing protein [Vicinamibacterales bacterium]